MSDLISREALLLELSKERREPLYYTVQELITTAPAIEQGEVVGKVNRSRDMGDGTWFGIVDIDYEKVKEGDYLYTTPQQPQSVADALEEVISIVWDVLDNPELSGHGYCNDLEGRIRALIKRIEVRHASV